MALLTYAITGYAQDVTATWDFKNRIPESLSTVAFQGNTGTVASDVEGISMSVDATNGKFNAKDRQTDVQFNQGTILQIPVKNAGDEVTVVNYPNYNSYTIGNEAATADENTHKATVAEGKQGYVEVIATGGCYLYSVKVVQKSKIQEKCIYSSDITDWPNTTSSTTASSFNLKTKFSNETFTVKVSEVAIKNGTEPKFKPADYRAAMCAKTATPYIETSALANITKVVFKHGATGGSRGYKLLAKGEGETEWTVISDAVANPASGAVVEKAINKKNCQLRFENLTSDQNAYLFNLEIYGMVDMGSTPSLGSFKLNGTQYEAADIFDTNDGINYTATIKISKKADMISATNPLTDISAANGELGEITYSGSATSAEVKIPVTYGEATANYTLTVEQYQDKTLTYYNVDGTEIGTQAVEDQSPIAEFKYGAADVTAADGMKFRGWLTKKDGTTKYKTTDIVSADISLYPLVTEIEDCTGRYVYALNSEDFDADDHENFLPQAGTFHDSTHGWVFKPGDKVIIPVGGNANIFFTLCQYSTSGNITVTGPNDFSKSIQGKVSSDGSQAAVEYEGEAGNLEVTFVAGAYIHQIIVSNVKNPKYTKSGNFITVEPGSITGLYQALDLANSKATNDRFCIFLPDGTYDMGSTALTAIAKNNISIIGQSMDKTIIVNKPLQEGIGVTATFLVNKNVTGTYFQDLTLKNAIEYYTTGQAGRAVCLQDKGDKTICKNVRMLSYQDTYYSNNASGKFYFENSEIHGTVDFICGGGQAYFNKSLIYVEPRNADGTGGCTITAPYTEGTKYGYVFNECTIDNHTAEFNLGRAWGGQPKCAWLNTTMKMNKGKIAATRYTTGGMNVAAKEFYEYNSMDENGTVISPASNKLTFTHSSGNNANFETILTAEKAADFALDKVFTTWAPDKETVLPNVTSAKIKDNVITWDAVEGAIMYAVFKDGILAGTTTETTYTVEQGINDTRATAVYTVRAANANGGFSVAATAGDGTGISGVILDDSADTPPVYNLAGQRLSKPQKGINIIGGKKVIVK